MDPYTKRSGGLLFVLALSGLPAQIDALVNRYDSYSPVQRNESGPAARYYNQSVDESADPRVPDTRLAVYGTLAPGRVNHHQISALRGNWQRGTVKGNLFSAGWGAAMGFPGLILDPLGPSLDVDLFESMDLPQHWARLDEFEGRGYRRAVTTVNTAEGNLSAWIYVLAEDQP